MNGSFHIGKLFGVDVRLHYLWVVMVGGFALLMPGYLWLWIPLFGIVLLHELGHSLVAKHFGIRVLDITLWPLGGMARMSNIPEDTRIEALIAIAGPMVNFGLAALAIPFLQMGPFAQFFFASNLVIGTFNLIPAFPMDGGRVLRALLGRSGDWVHATEVAVRVGRFFALLIIVAGIFIPRAGCMLPIIGIWIWWAGMQELFAVRMRHQRAAFAGFPFGEGGLPNEPHQAHPQRPHEEQPEGFSGWTEGEIERLEDFRGPLSQYRPDEEE